MLPSSHFVPIRTLTGTSGPQAQLAAAFAEFTAAASRVERSYDELQKEVAQLRRELEARNAALSVSVAENERMRTSLQLILSELPCGVIVVDATGNEVIFLNPEAHRLTGIEMNTGVSTESLPSSLRAALRQRAGEEETEVSVETPTAKRWLAVRKSRMHLMSSSQPGCSREQVILILSDISARRQTEEQRETSRSVVALAEISAVLAHEIRNPLASLELFIDLLVSHASLDSASQEWVGHMQAGIRTLSATVNNVLRLHTLSSAELRPINLQAALQSGIEFVRPLAIQSGIALQLESELGDSEIAGDPNGLHQVILNLACNAFRHTASGGRLVVSARTKASPSGRTAVVEFRDSGRGISAEHLPHVFDVGFSGSGQRSGLGLTICQRIVQQHGGTIRIKSSVGQGTNVCLEFPTL